MTIAVSQPAGNYYDKYYTSNPIAQLLMNGFLSTFDRLSEIPKAGTVHEVGCGEGYLSIRLAERGMKTRACDIATEAIETASRNIHERGFQIPLKIASLYDLTPFNDSSDLVICCEVLEHLPDPNRAIDILAQLASPWLLASVPREPVWRILNVCRGKYLASFGNTPGHIQHWSTASFRKLLERRFEIVEMATPLPWSMALCRVKNGA